MQFAAVHESAFGTKRTFAALPARSDYHDIAGLDRSSKVLGL